VKNSLKSILIVVMVIALISSSVVERGPVQENDDPIANIVDFPTPSDEVWSDNFDDEDISDWQIFGVNYTADADCYLPSSYDNFSVEGGVLRAIGPEWNVAGHNSSVAYGTWSFDVDIQMPDGYNHFPVAFISEQFNEDWLSIGPRGEAYGFSIYPSQVEGEGRISFIRASHDVDYVELDIYRSKNLVGWKNIMVTRELSGQFYVYLDGKLIMEAVNQYHTTSERFYFLTMANPGIDNINVSNTIDYDAAPPKLESPLENKEITLGESFYYDLNATDYSGIDQWWINDTVNFAIDADGTITNIKDLVVGDYGIQVNVNDTRGNTKTSMFTLTIKARPVLIPLELIIATVGVVAVVVVVLIIWRTKRR
jgi:hypothetical protein